MKKTYCAIGCLIALLSTSFSADIKFSDLPAASSISGADLIPIVQGGVSKKATISLLPLKEDPLSQFAPTTSSQFKGTISDENAPDGASSKVILALGSLSIASGKTGTFSNTLTFTGTDSSSVAFGTGGTVLYSLTGDVTTSGSTSTIGTGKVTDAKSSLLVKPAVALVAASNLTLSGEQTIDGVLTSGSLVLATAQTSGAENGPWVTAAGAWARPTWYTSGSTTQAPQFLTTFVRLGTTYQGSTWRMTTASVTIDTTATTWVQTPITTASLPVDTDGTLAANSDTKIATQKAGKTYVDARNSATITYTNKRITKRVGTTASSATPSIDSDSYDEYTITALAAAITSLTVTGTPTEGQSLILRIKDDGNARALAFGTGSCAFSTDLAAPTTTTAGKYLYCTFLYNTTLTKWVLTGKLDNL